MEEYKNSSHSLLAFHIGRTLPVLEPKLLERSRRTPSQARSQQTVDFILDAAAQILGREGENAATTNNIAERAGFSIGTLYQYFANRDEILIALANRDQRRIADHFRTLVRQIELGNGLDSARAFIEVLVRSIKGRRRGRRYFTLIATLKASGRMPVLGDEFAEVLAETWSRLGDDRGPLIKKIHAYVLTHALLGVLRNAAASGSRFIEEPAFADALFRIVIAFSRSGAPVDTNNHATGR
jgi:AcrR family transcriptional regulator